MVRMKTEDQAAPRTPTSEDWARIRLFAMDVDGVLTDGTVRISSDGSESKVFSILDGLGLVRLRDVGIGIAWISGRASGATTKRAEELRVSHLVQGRSDKVSALQELMEELGLQAEEVCYMGDDDIDVAAIELAGIGISVDTGMPSAQAIANYIPKRPAGRGAVREVCELILNSRKGGSA